MAKEPETGIIYSNSGIDWNITFDMAVGGKFIAPNSSGGYHKLLKEWWDHYGKDKKEWLLISENNQVKSLFEKTYPDKRFYTTELYDDFNKTTDFELDLCNVEHTKQLPRVDVIICQATLEHVYDGYGAVKNMVDTLSSGGYLFIHTHTPGFVYHQYPRDYLRFYPDWFEDIPSTIGNIELKELVSVKNHIFSVYGKNDG
jgi:hypothetical protein